MKKKKRSTKAFNITASLLVAFSLIAPTVASAETTNKLHESLRESSVSNVLAKDKISDRLLTNFKDEEKITFLVKFKDKAEAQEVAKEARKTAKEKKLSAQNTKLVQRSAVVSELKSTSIESQRSVIDFLEQEAKKGNVDDFDSYYIVNGMAVTATKEIAEKIATFSEVEKVLPNETRKLEATVVEDAPAPASEVANVEWNVARVKAPETWEMGIDGSGTVVASIDTGVQWDHPALKEKYRGYNAATGEVDHDYNWFDATAGQDEPYDDQGHGTHVTGTMVGSEPDGTNQIGVAPGAKFIAVKAFTAAGGTDADLLEAAEWILAPTDSEGNARVDLAPDVVNNSWGGGPGLDEWYRDVVNNWRAAEIFPEFSAGNTTLTNPGGPGSVAAPANYPESFATGATDINNKVASFSLRGPSPYDEIKPDISAPGVNIRSSVPGGAYEGGWNGTSMSGPAVSGVAALLRQVNANITVDEMEEILLNTATPLTDEQYPESPNHGYGYGLVDAYSAVSSIISGLGTIEGQVTKQGEDAEAPTFEHVAPEETFEGMDLPLSISISDNISISSVHLNYTDANGEVQSIEAGRLSGDYKSGEFGVVVPGSLINGSSFKYFWTINDFGNNEVTSDEYTVEVKPGITTGYFTDFENQPTGWYSFGNANSWEWGVPTSGPGNAASGEKVYATNLEGTYDNNMNATLVMPPVDLPEGNAYLQFKHWHNFEKSSTGRAWDYGHVVISTDLENWTQLLQVNGVSNGWLSTEVNLSEYAGQRVYIGFNSYSDGSVMRDGWYIDDVALSDSSLSKKQLGIIKEVKTEKVPKLTKKEKAAEAKKEKTEKPIDPKTIKPVLPEKAPGPIVEEVANPTLLPLGAQVSVLESGRSVYTNPGNGSYSLTHSAGDFTVKAEAYGFASEQQSVELEADGSVSANFTLEELPQNSVAGAITDQQTGEPIEGATLLLVEDANIAPVITDANGSYSITAYEGDYTLKVVADGYHSKEVAVSIDGDGATMDISLKPFYTYPGGEIGYDDGTAENARAFYDAGNGWGVKMSLPEGEESGIVTDGVFRFWDTSWPAPGGTDFKVEVWDATGANGAPGKKIAGPIDAKALRNGEWTVVDLREHNIVVNGDFYMVYIQAKPNPNAPGLGTDEDGKNAARSYQFVSGAWTPAPAEEGNYMIRARVSYEVDAPVITGPTDSLITNEKSLTVTGTASPTTKIELKHNGKDAGTVDVGENGQFEIPVTLVEGQNELKAISTLNGRTTGESTPISVTLDTVKPAVKITEPTDGAKINRETVTVKGTIEDANLEFVKVNGQAATVKDGQFSKRIILENGSNEIKVVAQDLAGNRTTKTMTVSVDYDAPVIENVKPAKDLYIQTGKSVMIEFDSEPGLRATFMVHMPLTNTKAQAQNATELPLMEMSPGHYVGYYTVPSGTVADGAQIEVKAVDSFKNETRMKAAGKLYINVDQPTKTTDVKSKGDTSDKKAE
ncbi:S8 family serine peptidase [Ureibacillus sp. Re31]|uniref:S8 family serine peptidase n=1 Tax=Ureibacillus galli TaxID=2762222 RepID=A0ABR8XC20_9BACL|nr:S8 family peptidase [Ureibacillus galli]MBD8026767.1 S8 family serine peptidase [Ureibacillus galli]